MLLKGAQSGKLHVARLTDLLDGEIDPDCQTELEDCRLRNSMP